ncbi:MAG: ion transporter [Hymenobacter sp.]|nr:ion transporter [Hymenobacter sp.]
MKQVLLQNQLHRLLWQHGLLLLLGLALYLLDKHEGLPADVITGLLLAAAAGKTGYFLLHNFRALAALRDTFQQFLLLVSLNLGMIALSFALDFYCLYRVNGYAFAGLRPGSELEIFGQLFYHSVGTLISNSGGTVTAAAGTTQVLLLLEKIAGFVSTVFVISNAANYLGPLPKTGPQPVAPAGTPATPPPEAGNAASVAPKP